MPGLSSLSASLIAQTSSARTTVNLTELDEKSDSALSTLAFQYFPETLQDSKSVNYQQREIPGGSLPIYQWINSGARQISFTAYFSTDMNLLKFGVKGRIAAAGEKSRNIDINAAIVWLRRFMLPRYNNGRTYAPRKCFLNVPNSGIGAAGGINITSSQSTINDTVLCVMTQCEVSYEAFFPNGSPRLATVQLTFDEVAQLSGDVFFPRADSALDRLVSNNYTISPKKI